MDLTDTISQGILGKEARAENRDWCEHCGTGSVPLEEHHIKTRGAGGPNIRANLIRLCLICHKKAQERKISPDRLIMLVSKREIKPLAEIYDALKWTVPDKNKEEVTRINLLRFSEEPALEEPALEEPALEEPAPTNGEAEKLLGFLVQIETQDKEMKFEQGKVVMELVNLGMTLSQIAKEAGNSAAYWRSRLRVYQAFPDEDSREPALSWSHHRSAANTDDPAHWISVAAGDNEEGKPMSVRNLNKAINMADEEIAPIQEEEEKKEFNRASKTYRAAFETINAGGEAAAWLARELKKLLSDVPAWMFQAQDEEAV